MTSQQLDEERIFQVARRLGDAELRSEYLDQICAGNQALRESVEALIATHEGEVSFLKSAEMEVAPTVDQGTAIERPGTMVGRYKLMEQIGEGGMGTVFVAHQKRPLHREVALKVIKAGMDTKAVVARFEAERQTLAVMNHPNIAKVYDAGSTDNGRPYFVMELVHGISITQYCDDHKLTIPERLDLFSEVCEAIQHAHQKGIIHRDIKPSNILVTEQDGKPIPKVIDFGVAKAIGKSLTERTVYTSFQAVVGTPLYMSPEQAALSNVDVDTRSDVYSLGVLLYELLSGTTPFDKETFRTAAQDEVLRIIREQEPPKPSTRITTLGERAPVVSIQRRTDSVGLGKIIRGELDWIVMKALDKDRNRRYATANEFSEDIRRHLDKEAVVAGPDSAAYRLRKAVRKYKVAVSTAGLVLTVVLIGVGVSSFFAWRSNRLARELQQTLVQLQDEMLDHAFRLALSGDVVEVEDALARAEQAESPKDLIDAIRGIAYVHSDLDKAISLLNQAVEDNTDNLTALCALTWAYYFASRYDQMCVAQDRLARSEKHELNDFARLLLAQTRVFGVRDPQDLIDELDTLIEKHPRWGMAYAIRAEAKVELGQLAQSFPTLLESVNDAEKARRLLSDSPFVMAAAMSSYNYAIQLARFQNRDAAQLEYRASIIATELERWPSHMEGRMRRGLYFKLMGEKEKYEAEFRALLEKGMGAPQPELGERLARTDARDLREFVEKHDSPSSRIVLAIRHVVDGDESEANRLLAQLEKEYTVTDFRCMMLNVLQVAGRKEDARQFAMRTLEQSPGHDIPTVWRWDFFGSEFAAGRIDKQELLRLAGPFHWEASSAHYHIGLDALSRGNKDDARKHLMIAKECAAPGWWLRTIAEALLRLVDQGKLPVTQPAQDR